MFGAPDPTSWRGPLRRRAPSPDPALGRCRAQPADRKLRGVLRCHPTPDPKANQHSGLINSERAGPASAPRGTARPRRPRARPRTKMATAMYLEHYLDSKRPSRPPSPAPAQSTPPHGSPRTPGSACGPRRLVGAAGEVWSRRGRGDARGAGRGREEVRAGGAAQGPTVTAAPIPGASRRGGTGWRGAGLAYHCPALPG